MEFPPESLLFYCHEDIEVDPDADASLENKPNHRVGSTLLYHGHRGLKAEMVASIELEKVEPYISSKLQMNLAGTRHPLITLSYGVYPDAGQSTLIYWSDLDCTGSTEKALSGGGITSDWQGLEENQRTINWFSVCGESLFVQVTPSCILLLQPSAGHRTATSSVSASSDAAVRVNVLRVAHKLSVAALGLHDRYRVEHCALALPCRTDASQPLTRRSLMALAARDALVVLVASSEGEGRLSLSGPTPKINLNATIRALSCVEGQQQEGSLMIAVACWDQPSIWIVARSGYDKQLNKIFSISGTDSMPSPHASPYADLPSHVALTWLYANSSNRSSHHIHVNGVALPEVLCLVCAYEKQSLNVFHFQVQSAVGGTIMRSCDLLEEISLTFSDSIAGISHVPFLRRASSPERDVCVGALLVWNLSGEVFLLHCRSFSQRRDAEQRTSVKWFCDALRFASSALPKSVRRWNVHCLGLNATTLKIVSSDNDEVNYYSDYIGGYKLPEAVTMALRLCWLEQQSPATSLPLLCHGTVNGTSTLIITSQRRISGTVKDLVIISRHNDEASVAVLWEGDGVGGILALDTSNLSVLWQCDLRNVVRLCSSVSMPFDVESCSKTTSDALLLLCSHSRKQSDSGLTLEFTLASSQQLSSCHSSEIDASVSVKGRVTMQIDCGASYDSSRTEILLVPLKYLLTESPSWRDVIAVVTVNHVAILGWKEVLQDITKASAKCSGYRFVELCRRPWRSEVRRIS